MDGVEKTLPDLTAAKRAANFAAANERVPALNQYLHVCLL